MHGRSKSKDIVPKVATPEKETGGQSKDNGKSKPWSPFRRRSETPSDPQAAQPVMSKRERRKASKKYKKEQIEKMGEQTETAPDEITQDKTIQAEAEAEAALLHAATAPQAIAQGDAPAARRPSVVSHSDVPSLLADSHRSNLSRSSSEKSSQSALTGSGIGPSSSVRIRRSVQQLDALPEDAFFIDAREDGNIYHIASRHADDNEKEKKDDEMDEAEN